MKKVLWKEKFDHDQKALLIDPNEIENMVYADTLYLITTETLDEDDLQKAYEQYKKENGDIKSLYDLEDFLDEFFPGSSCQGAAYLESVRDQIVFDGSNFDNLKYFEPVKVYRWWDGSNWRTEVCDRNAGTTLETEIEISDQHVCLDEWDGRNMTTGGMGLHQYVHLVFNVDGDPVRDTYLVVFASQWQGSHTTAEIMTEDELRAHLESIGRDVDEYMAEINETR